MITLNFDEVLKRIYNAKKGVEVRYGLGQGFEYCKQFADEAQGYATNAKASEKKATDAVAGIEQTKTDAVQAVQNAQTTATAAITQTKDAALTDIGNAKTGALQEVANSTATAETAASAAAGFASDANASKEAAATSASAAAASASAASTSETNSSASESAAQKSAEEAAASATLAGTRAGTDKTLKTENAPADAAAVGDIVLDPDGNAIFYSKAEVEAKIKEILAAQREEDLARIKFWASNDPTSPASFIGGTWERIEDCTIWGASDTHPAGTTVEAGLPNVKGSFSFESHAGDGGWLKVASATGAFYGSQAGGGAVAQAGINDTGSMSVGMDASKSSQIYGASDTVQPPAYCMYIWRRVA